MATPFRLTTHIRWGTMVPSPYCVFESLGGPKVQISAIASLLERTAGSGTNTSHVLVKVEGPVRIELSQALKHRPQAGVLGLEFKRRKAQRPCLQPLVQVPQAGQIGLQPLYA